MPASFLQRVCANKEIRPIVMDGDEQEKKLVLGKDPVDYVCFGEHTGLT